MSKWIGSFCCFYKHHENFSSRYPYTKSLLYFLNIYRPPSSSTPTFFEQDIHHTKNHSLINSFNLIQKVNFLTHIHEHTLDLVLTKSNNDKISNVHTTDAFYDHFSLVSPQICQPLDPKLMLLLPFINTIKLIMRK